VYISKLLATLNCKDLHVGRGYVDTILPKDGPGILYWHVDGKTRLSPGQWTRDVLTAPGSDINGSGEGR
jgi:hypothetical protein